MNFSLLDFITNTPVYNGGIAAAGIVMIIVVLAACLLAGVSGAKSLSDRAPGRLALAAAVMGFLSVLMHIIIYSRMGGFLGGFLGGAFGYSVGYGFYLNLCLLVVATVLVSCLSAMSSKTAVVRTAPDSGRVLAAMSAPGQEASGVIVGKAGMYRYATFKIRDGEEFIIGRDAAMAHIVVDTGAEKVSRKHCSIVYDGRRRQYIVTDHSSNGTYTEDGARLESMVMKTLPCGTTIHLGNSKNSFLLN